MRRFAQAAEDLQIKQLAEGIIMGPEPRDYLDNNEYTSNEDNHETEKTRLRISKCNFKNCPNIPVSVQIGLVSVQIGRKPVQGLMLTR